MRPEIDYKSRIKQVVEAVTAGLMSRESAVLQLGPEAIDRLVRSSIEPGQEIPVMAKGLSTTLGAAVGRVYFSIEAALSAVERGDQAILAKRRISGEDVCGFEKLAGILAPDEDPSGHAAIVAAGLEKPFVINCASLEIDPIARTLGTKKLTVREGDWISLDGFSGEILAGSARVSRPVLPEEFHTFMGWTTEMARMSVKGNADLPSEAKQAILYGAVALEPRTEHMFLEGGRLAIFRRMILAETGDERKEALERLLPMQRQDFTSLFDIARHRPIVARLLDPPLHEFLPSSDKALMMLADDMGLSLDALVNKVTGLKESNPMMGHRGCRLLVTYPEIVAMQTKALLEAAAAMRVEGLLVSPEINIPMVAMASEITAIKKVIIDVAAAVQRTTGLEVPFLIGAMIETPRAALMAGAIAREVDFLSFGTNDLTAQTFAFSRGDAFRKFLFDYLEQGIVDDNPFQTLDVGGVGRLMKIAVREARRANPKIKIGICGEQGGEQRSIEFCERLGLDSISCTPSRIPAAKLFAAQAAIRHRRRSGRKLAQEPAAVQ